MLSGTRLIFSGESPGWYRKRAGVDQGVTLWHWAHLTDWEEEVVQEKRNVEQVQIEGFFFLRFILLLAALDLHCRARAFSSCSRWGLLFVVGHRLLIVALFRAWVLGHEGFSSYRSWALEHRLTSCGAQAQLLWGRWDLPRPGIKTMSPELAGRLSTTRLPRKPHKFSLKSLKITYKNCKDNF